MRETNSLISTPTVKHTLKVVRNQFGAWRKRKRRGRHIPEALWQAAVELCKVKDSWRVFTVDINFFERVRPLFEQPMVRNVSFGTDDLFQIFIVKPKR